MGEIIDMKPNQSGLYVPTDTPEPARETHLRVVKTKADIERNFIKLGAYLKLMHDEALYVHEDCLTWTEYLDLPDVDLSRSQAFKLMAVYDRWVLKYGHDPEELVGTSLEKLYIASSQATNESHEEWLTKAKVLSRADLKAETNGGKQHYQIVICPHCHEEFELKKETFK